jgi:uncharacterized membrane protein
MQLRRIDASRAIGWYGFGWHTFARSPGIWVAVMLLLAVIVLTLQLIPLIGPLVLSLISPALTGGLMYGAKEAADGRPVKISHVFMGLVQEDTRASMLILGGVMLGLSILFAIVAAIIVGGSAGVGTFSGAANDANGVAVATGAMGLGLLLTFLVTVIFTLATFAVLAFAIPLVMFERTPPVEAIKSSVDASLKNLASMTVFVIVYLVSAIIAAIPFFLGFIVLIPVTAAALYAGFRDIYSVDTAVVAEPRFR